MLPKITQGKDTFIATYDGIDHESWGETDLEAFHNFYITMRDMKNMNTEEAWKSFFDSDATQELFEAQLDAYNDNVREWEKNKLVERWEKEREELVDHVESFVSARLDEMAKALELPVFFEASDSLEIAPHVAETFRDKGGVVILGVGKYEEFYARLQQTKPVVVFP